MVLGTGESRADFICKLFCMSVLTYLRATCGSDPKAGDRWTPG